MEKRKQWNFRMSKDNSWSWHAVDTDGTESACKQEYGTLAECIVDARKNGYVVWNPTEERRRNPTKQALE